MLVNHILGRLVDCNPGQKREGGMDSNPFENLIILLGYFLDWSFISLFLQEVVIVTIFV